MEEGSGCESTPATANMSDLSDWEKDSGDEAEAAPAVKKPAAPENEWEGEDAEEPSDAPQAPGDRFAGKSHNELVDMIKQLELEVKGKGKPKNAGKLKREAIKRREAEERARREAQLAAALAEAKLTAEEIAAKKLSDQQKVEEADLELSKELFGGAEDAEAGPKVVLIEAMDPTNKEEFERFGAAIAKKVTKFEESAFYPEFLENLVRDLTLGVKADVVRKAGSALTRIANAKAQAEKGNKKKKSTKATLGGGKGGAGAFDDYSAYGGGEDGFDDGFM